MKILWFAITPCGAAEKLMPDIHTAGWLASLEKHLKLDTSIELSVCFYHYEELNAFEYKSVNYIPVKRGQGSNKAGKFIDRVNSFRPGIDTPYLPKLLEVIESVKPDLVHIHGTEDNFGLVQRYTTVPVVVSVQSILTPYCEKYFSGIPLNDALKHERWISKILLDSVMNQFFLLSRVAKREREILKHTKYIIGRTNWDRRITRILAPESRYFIGNEIMRSSFYQHRWNKSGFNKKLQIVTTMSGGLYKGLEAVLKTASVLTESGLNFTWTVIGQSESGSYARLVERWIKKDYSANGVVFAGKKSEKEVCEMLCKADIYCQVSHIENSPNSLCEAMLLGMPIVATLAGGTDSMLENGQHGLLIQDGDSYSMAGAIVELASDFDTSCEYGNNARRTAMERHDPERVANEVIEVYKEIYSLVNNNELWKI